MHIFISTSPDLERQGKASLEAFWRSMDLYPSLIDFRRADEVSASVIDALKALEKSIRTSSPSKDCAFQRVTKKYGLRRHNIEIRLPSVPGYWTPQGVKTYDQLTVLAGLSQVVQAGERISSKYASALDFAGSLADFRIDNDVEQFVISVKAPQPTIMVAGAFSYNSNLQLQQTFSNLEQIEESLTANAVNVHGTFLEQIYESIQKDINTFRKRLNHIYHAILVSLSRKLRFKQGIRKGIEGYIPFQTWARGSLRTRLVNWMLIIDRLSLSHPYFLEISNGC